MPPEFVIETRLNRAGVNCLYFPAMWFSDLHLGTRQCRGNMTDWMLGQMISGRLHLVGDGPDGVYLRDKDTWKFGHPEHSWHRQVIAQICRKEEEEGPVVYIPGNHDWSIREQTVEYKGTRDEETKEYTGEGWRGLEPGAALLHHNLCGKSIYFHRDQYGQPIDHGIHVAERTYYTEPVTGRRFLIIHGDQHDAACFRGNSKFFYKVGDYLHDGLVAVDTQFQKIPRCDDISVAAVAKKGTKFVIYRGLGVRKEIIRVVDLDDNIDGIIYGHSHMGTVTERTPGGKFIFNDDCCTEYAKCLVHDRNGIFALLTFYQTGFKVQDENGHERFHAYEAYGLEPYDKHRLQPETEYTYRADRLIRLIYREWSAKDRRYLAQMHQFLDVAGNTMHPRAYREQRLAELLNRSRKAGVGIPQERLRDAARLICAAGEDGASLRETADRVTNALCVAWPARDTGHIIAAKHHLLQMRAAGRVNLEQIPLDNPYRERRVLEGKGLWPTIAPASKEWAYAAD
ncbi:MAG TPA: hypothetical protein VMV79_03980 [Alphaproteobacteria bacterium]|nr:hypothetical protein [Alphaproteobacteria bacterium]